MKATTAKTSQAHRHFWTILHRRVVSAGTHPVVSAKETHQLAKPQRRVVQKWQLHGRILLAVAIFFTCALTARAQFTGFSVPQTTQATPFNNVACTGAQQVATVGNFGQTEHYITITTTGGVTAFRATIQGSHDAVLYNDISDVATQSGSTVMGQGYYPIFQVSVTCASAVGSFTVKYSGQATAPAPQIGAMVSGQGDKTFAVAVAAGASFTAQSIRTPFGNSGGAIYFQYAAAGPANSSINVSCFTLAIATSTSVASFPLATSTTPQFFAIPLLPCDFVTTTYTPGGASATTFTASYVFNNQTITGGDPCQGATATKKSAAINVTSATTTQLVALISGHQVLVCGYNFTLSPTGANATTAQLEYGTGASCGTGTTVLSGTFDGSGAATGTVAPVHVMAGGGYAVATTPTGQALCIVTTGATVRAQGILTFVQQ